jgi:hypothetical protein
MSKRLLPILTIFFTLAGLGLNGLAADTNVDLYHLAVSNYFEVPLEDVTQTMDRGIPVEELPVVFAIAGKADVPSASVVDSRLKDNSWAGIAAAHNMTAADFYVGVSNGRHGARYSRIIAKFTSLPRSQFDQATLTDSDIIALVNLKFLYKHYNYSQHLIMTWSGEGKSFIDINHLIYAATTKVETPAVADSSQENAVDSSKADLDEGNE